MMELADKYSKAAIVNMFRVRQNTNIRKQIKKYMKDPNRISREKNAISKMKNTLDRVSSRLHNAEENDQ